MDSYTGDVTVSGPAQSRDLGRLRVTKVAVGDYANNCYLLECLDTSELLLIDAAASAETLLGLVGGRDLRTVVTTHQHADHWQALQDVVAATGAETVASAPDCEGIPVATDRLVGEGDTVRVGSVELSILQFSGHTPGSIALAYVDPAGSAHVWTGDCLFPGGVGKTSSPEAFDSLYSGVVERIFDRYADDTWIYPGHGRDTTLGAERPHLQQWRDRGW